MNLEELKEEIEVNFESYPHEVRQYINYLEDKSSAYFNLILDIKTKLHNKQYNEAERDLSHALFYGVTVQGYE